MTEAGWIVRQDIQSPYAFGPTHLVYDDPKRGKVIIVETSHKRFDVFAIGEIPVYETDELASEAHEAEGIAPRHLDGSLVEFDEGGAVPVRLDRQEAK